MQHWLIPLVFEESAKSNIPNPKSMTPNSIHLLGLSILTVSSLHVHGVAHGQPAKDQKVEIEARLSHTAAGSDSTIFVALILTIEKGWHINSATPSDETLIATSAELQSSPDIEVVATRYPESVKKKFAFSEDPVDVYEGKATIVLKLHISSHASPGRIQVPVDITYQACNDVLCSAPTTGRVNVSVHIVPPGTPVSTINDELFKGIVNH